MTGQITLFELDSYQEFVDKFRPKKTTDDCYTPPDVYEAVRDWAVDRYALHGREIVRPFWPGGDFERVQYPAGCVVIDNPPFSIMKKILTWYLDHAVDFFLFAPGLSLFKDDPRLGYVICDLSIRYENGAEVPTSFVTNLGENVLETAPMLSQLIRSMQKNSKTAPKYEYPPEIITAAKLRYVDGKGIRFELPRTTPRLLVRKIDANKDKGIFGSAFLVGKKAAQAQAQAQAQAKVQAKVFTLSETERLMVDILTEREIENAD